MKHLLGLLRAQQGSVRVFGLEPTRYPVEVLRDIRYLWRPMERSGCGTSKG